jgi:hypothetical protein
MVECLLCEVLNSNPSPTKKKIKSTGLMFGVVVCNNDFQHILM